MSARAVSIDDARVAQLFERVPVAQSFIAREVAQRMAERLDLVRLDARRVLDLGCGAGDDHALLVRRFPESTVLAIDRAHAVLNVANPAAQSGPTALARRVSKWFTGAAGPPGPQRVRADFRALPFVRAAGDLIWSNLALHWDDEPHEVLGEWARVLRPEGLIMFSAFGPDTLSEVRSMFAQVDGLPHTLDFTDMHDYGDMLVASGFAAPVVDMEHITLTYTSMAALWQDVRALGGNPLSRRRRGLWGRAARERLARGIESARGPDGLWRLTFEVIYGHAWRGIPRTTEDGRAIVRLEGLARQSPTSN